MARSKRAKPAKRRTLPAATILTWEDDPGSGAPPLAVTAPDPGGSPLAYRFPAPAPKPGQYARGTAAFRYWVAVEALRRGADYFKSRVPGGRWQMGATLPVRLDAGVDLNAYYDRRALHFFHDTTAAGVVYTGESPDVLCHEMGHAILDSVKPELWDAASDEVAAFHESFGDMCAMLCALQLPSLRTAVLAETRGRLARNSRLSRLAEQLGAAIRAQHPDAVDADCLRNAANAFIYQDPLTLPYSAPAAQLSSESHSFSRVFTAAFLDALGGTLAATARDPAAPTEQELLAAGADLGDVLMAGIEAAPVRPDFYAQVASGMVRAAATRSSAQAAALRTAFARRAILAAGTPLGAAARAARRDRRPSVQDLLELDGRHYGLRSGSLRVVLASCPRTDRVAGRTASRPAHGAPDADAAARAFVATLFRRGRIDLGHRRSALALASPHALKTHCLVAERGQLTLRRRLFDCGCRHG